MFYIEDIYVLVAFHYKTMSLLIYTARFWHLDLHHLFTIPNRNAVFKADFSYKRASSWICLETFWSRCLSTFSHNRILKHKLLRGNKRVKKHTAAIRAASLGPWAAAVADPGSHFRCAARDQGLRGRRMAWPAVLGWVGLGCVESPCGQSSAWGLPTLLSRCGSIAR